MAIMDPTLEVLKSIDEQLRLIVRLQLAPVYATTISTPELQRLYKNTGTKTVTALAKEFGMSTGKISMLWQQWERLGLLKKQGNQYSTTM